MDHRIPDIFIDFFDVAVKPRTNGVIRGNIAYTCNRSIDTISLMQYIEQSLQEYDTLSALNIPLVISLSGRPIVDNVYKFVAKLRAITNDPINVIHCTASMSARLNNILAYEYQGCVEFKLACLCGSGDVITTNYDALKRLDALHNELKN